MRNRYAFAIALLLTPIDGSCQDTPIERVRHDHSIYTLSGDPSTLDKFDAEVFKNWSGGVLIDGDEGSSAYRYWAFDWRTAAQSRQFLIAARSAGLDLEIAEYNDADEYPELRAKLDEALSECGTSFDPFVILPTRHVTIFERTESTNPSAACLLELIQDEKRFEGLKFGFVGAERKASDESE